jgi:hypothetical protein
MKDLSYWSRIRSRLDFLCQMFFIFVLVLKDFREEVIY